MHHLIHGVYANKCQLRRCELQRDSEVAPETSVAPTLLSTDWSLGVSTRCSTSTSLAAPFVMLDLRIAHPDGRVAHEPVRLTISQLTALEVSLREAATALERA